MNRPIDLDAVARSAWNDFQRLPMLLITQSVVLKFIEAWLLVPLIALGLSLVLNLSGHIAISNWDAIHFLISPIGVVYIAFLIAANVTFALLEQACLMNLVRLTRTTHQPRYIPSLTAAFPKPWRIAELGLFSLVAISGAAIPAALLGLVIYRSFLVQHDINYYLTEMPLNFWLAAASGVIVGLATVAVGTVVCVSWSLALPILLFEQKSSLAAIRDSRERIQGNAIRIGLILVTWLVLVVALGISLEFGFQKLAGFTLQFAGEQPYVKISLLLIGQLFLIGGISFVARTGFSLITRQLYLAVSPTMSPADRHSQAPESEHRSSLLRWCFASGPMICLAFTPFTMWASLDRLATERIPVRVTAHRGHSVAAPENTLSAVRKAIDSGADYAEIDVLLTSDGVPVLLHDSDLKRVAADERRIADLSSEEALQIDVGRWFGPEFVGETIPTLADVIRLARPKNPQDPPRIKLNIELKIYESDPRFVPAIERVIRESNFEPYCIITTFKYEALVELKQLNPKLKTGLIVANALGDVSRLDVDLLSVRASWLSDAVLHDAHRHGKEVHVWTVNEKPDMIRMIKRGVDNIITDDPDLLIQVRDQWENLSGTERLLLASRLLLGLKP